MRRPSRKLTRVILDCAALAPLFAQLVPLEPDAELIECTGWRDRTGILRRARALYADGLQVDVFLTLATVKAQISSYKMTWRGTISRKSA